MFAQVRFLRLNLNEYAPYTNGDIMLGFALCTKRVERCGLRTCTSLHLTDYYRSPCHCHTIVVAYALVSLYYKPIKTSSKKNRSLVIKAFSPSSMNLKLMAHSGHTGVSTCFSLIWLGWLDSNQRVRESKSLALPLGYTPIYIRQLFYSDAQHYH